MSAVRPGGQLRSLLRLRRNLSGATLRHRAWEDGVLGGDRRWLVAGGASWVVWAVRWAWRKEPEVIYRTEVKPGEAITIATSVPPRKKEAKRQAKATARAEKEARSRKARKRRKAEAKATARAEKAARKERKAEAKRARGRKERKRRKAAVRAARRQADVERAMPHLPDEESVA